MTSRRGFIFSMLSPALLLSLTLPANAAFQDELPGQAGWQVAPDPLTVITNEMNRLARRSGAPFHVTGISLNITRESGNDHTYPERQVLVDGWAYNLTERLERRGFRTTSSARFRSLFGITQDEFRERMIRAQPYGQRELAERHFGEFFVLINYQPSRCGPDEGAFAAMIMAHYPVEGSFSDYGSVGLFLLGAGECAANGGSQRELADLQRGLIEAFTGRR